MMRKLIIALIIIIFLPSVFYSTYNLFKKSEYQSKPEVVINRAIWLTETRVYDVLKRSNEEKSLNYKELEPLLTLEGNLNDNFNGMVGDDIYPKFANGYKIHEFFLGALSDGSINESEWKIVDKLTAYYKDLVYQQSILFDNNGKVNRQVLSALKNLESEIGNVVE